MEDLDEDEKHIQFDGQDATIFLIDSSVPMFQNPPPVEEDGEQIIEDCPFIQVLKCIHKILLSKIITAQNDSVAVVLFGTNMTVLYDDKYGVYPNTFVLQDLMKPDREPIEQLAKLFEDDESAKFRNSACSLQTFSLADSLWLCSLMFSKHKSKNDNKQIFMFTNTDEPHSKHSDKHKQAERRIGDLQENHVSLYLFPVGEDFSAEKIYKELLNDEEKILSGSFTLDDLHSKICRKCQKKRTLASLVFNIDSNLKFGVKLYNLTRPAPQPKRIDVDKRTNEPVKSVTTKFNAETAETLLPSELIKYTEVCGRKIQLDKNDIASLKAKFPPGFTLLGFKPIRKLKLHLHLSPGSFIYPDEDLVKGSCLIFGALLDRCAARDVAPLCSFKATAITKPRVVALLPHKENNPDQTPLFGFHVIYLPFRNDIRKLNIEDLVGASDVPVDKGTRCIREIWRADEDQIKTAKAIVKRLKCSYSPMLYQNPSLHAKWEMLEDQAFLRTEVGKVKDLTIPCVEDMDERLGARAEAFNDAVFPMGYQSSQITASRTHGPENEANVEAAARNGKLNSLTVDRLKGYLSSQGIRGFSNCKKAELIEKVKAHLNL